MDDLSELSELSDAAFMQWAGLYPRRWALLPLEKRDSWLEHLIARVKTTSSPDECKSLWRLAYVIAQADSPLDAEEVPAANATPRQRSGPSSSHIVR
jgi:hypothetical protein